MSCAYSDLFQLREKLLRIAQQGWLPMHSTWSYNVGILMAEIYAQVCKPCKIWWSLMNKNTAGTHLYFLLQTVHCNQYIPADTGIQAKQQTVRANSSSWKQSRLEHSTKHEKRSQWAMQCYTQKLITTNKGSRAPNPPSLGSVWGQLEADMLSRALWAGGGCLCPAEIWNCTWGQM